VTTALGSILAELERLADIWRREAMRLEMAGHSEIESHIRVCANDLLCVTRAIRAEHNLAENAGAAPPCAPGVTGRASSADDARPLSGGTQEKGGYAEARRQGV
jgi:hypothetical protein